MAIIPQKQIFSWEDIEEKGDLERLILVLNVIPDEILASKLEALRGKGTDKYPVRAVWNSIIAGIVFQHPSIESLRRELQRNGELRMLCGFNSFHGAKAVPTAWAYTRFLQNLIDHVDLINEMFNEMVNELTRLLPDFGETLAFDGKAIKSFAVKPGKKAGDKRGDHDANYGKHVHSGINSDGTMWQKVKSWFGYKIHLVVDSKYELPVGFEVTTASEAEVPVMHKLIDKINVDQPEILDRTKEAAGDRGYDDTKLIVKFGNEFGIKPVIDIRNMWKDGETTKLVKDTENVVYNFKGDVFCVCLKDGEQKSMAFAGFEKDRETLKYRCPAQEKGITCACVENCPVGKSIRIPLSEDPRVFTPLARSSYAWKTAYNKRTSVERVNSRIETSFGFDKHTIRGKKKMEVRCGLALCVMLALAIGHIKENKPDLIRSLVKTG